MLVYPNAIPSTLLQSVTQAFHQLSTQDGNAAYAEAVWDCVYVNHQLCSLDLELVIFKIGIHSIAFD